MRVEHRGDGYCQRLSDCDCPQRGLRNDASQKYCGTKNLRGEQIQLSAVPHDVEYELRGEGHAAITQNQFDSGSLSEIAIRHHRKTHMKA